MGCNVSCMKKGLSSNSIHRENIQDKVGKASIFPRARDVACNPDISQLIDSKTELNVTECTVTTEKFAQQLFSRPQSAPIINTISSTNTVLRLTNCIAKGFHKPPNKSSKVWCLEERVGFGDDTRVLTQCVGSSNSPHFKQENSTFDSIELSSLTNSQDTLSLNCSSTSSSSCDTESLNYLNVLSLKVKESDSLLNNCSNNQQASSESENSNSELLSNNSQSESELLNFDVIKQGQKSNYSPAFMEAGYLSSSYSTRTVQNGSNLLQFGSMQQLCSDIIKERLFSSLQSKSMPVKLMCLFVTGSQGSSKGELAFELIEHSGLLNAIASSDDQEDTFDHSDCPLYHHIDIATVIVTNIDARIKEYDRIVAKTSREKLTDSSDIHIDIPASKLIDATIEDDSSSEIQSFNAEIRKVKLDKIEKTNSWFMKENKKNDSSFDSQVSNQSTLTNKTSTLDDFGSLTLTTRNRSKLQLKLMKYFNSITSKWIFELLHSEIYKIETKVAQRWPDFSTQPKRVYLISLIPPELNIFKACLYLHQSVHLKNFVYPYFAVHFVCSKSQPLLARSKEFNSIDKHNKHSSRKLPLFGILGGGDGKKLSPNRLDTDQSKANFSPSCLALNDANEKLIEKFNRQFARQFQRKGRLFVLKLDPALIYTCLNPEILESDAATQAKQFSKKKCRSRQQCLEDSKKSDNLLSFHDSQTQLSLKTNDFLDPENMTIKRSHSIAYISDALNTDSNTSNVIKCAVGIEYCGSDEYNKKHEDDKRRNSTNSTNDNIINFFKSSLHLSKEKNRYQIVTVNLASHNKQVIEIRRTREKIVELESRRGLIKLFKLIKNCAQKLDSDFKQWLYNAILSTPAICSSTQVPIASPTNENKLMVNLVTYMIKVKVRSSLLLDPHHSADIKANLDLDSRPISVNLINKRPNLETSAASASDLRLPARTNQLMQSTSRPYSSCLFDERVQNHKYLKSHVQFRSNEEPRRRTEQGYIQHREWLGYNVFISYTDKFKSQHRERFIKNLNIIFKLSWKEFEKVYFS